MIKKKVCILGDFGVGKSSLIQKYVLNIYSEKYISTVGVKVDKKVLTIPDGSELTMLLWDMEGRNDYLNVMSTYLRGMSGYLIVCDGTRKITIRNGYKLFIQTNELFPTVPSVVMFNKYDLTDEWTVTDDDIADFTKLNIVTHFTSAKTGLGVEDAFNSIAIKMAAIDGQ